jgi:hypothetical protein
MGISIQGGVVAIATTKKTDPWRYVGKCVVCGSKLVFLRSKAERKSEEGAKTCQKNHERFVILGEYDLSGKWQMMYRLPSGTTGDVDEERV